MTTRRRTLAMTALAAATALTLTACGTTEEASTGAGSTPGGESITLTDGTVITDSIAVADAHPLGARPFARDQYINKFRTLAAGLVDQAEIDRFIAAAENLENLGAGELDQLNIQAADGVINTAAAPKGLF